MYIDAVAFLNSHFGAASGTRTVHLDEVECTGSETNLTDCPQSSTVSCSSVNSYAGVRCQGLRKQPIILQWNDNVYRLAKTKYKIFMNGKIYV